MSVARAHLGAAVTIFASTISGGLVAVPAAYQEAGLIPAIALALVACATTAMSLYSLGLISERTGQTSYGAVAERISGPVLGAVLDLAIGLFLTGVLAGSLIVLRDWFDALLQHNRLHTSLATAAIAVFGIFPLSLPRSIGVMAYASSVSIAAFACLVTVLVGYGAQELSHGVSDYAILPTAPSPLVFGQTFDVAIYQFACQFQLMAIYQDLRQRVSDLSGQTETAGRGGNGSGRRPPAALRFAAVVGGAACVMLLLGTLTGTFGVLAFPNR